MQEINLGSLEALIIACGAMGMGMVMLIRCGNWVVDAAVYLAKHMGVSRLLVGLTIVAFGTSLPELIVSVTSNFQGLPGIALGNVIGSNTANILLILGATALVSSLTIPPKRIARDLFVMLGATIALAALMLSGHIGHLAGLTMIGALMLYTYVEYRKAKAHGFDPHDEEDDPIFKNLATSLLFLGLGLAGIAMGAEFLVRGAKTGASIVGVPDAVIGLSIIAIGTSLPELSTCLIAASKKQTDIVLGNIIGSNIFNILMIVGMTALLKPVDLSLAGTQLVKLDIWIALAVSLLLSVLLLLHRKINRFLGILFLAAYTVYIMTIFALYIV